MSATSIAILGCGNIGSAIARGLVKSGNEANNIILTRRKTKSLNESQKAGFQITDDNILAVKESKIIIIAVGPSQLLPLLINISSHLKKNHLIISIVSGVEIANKFFRRKDFRQFCFTRKTEFFSYISI